MRLKFNKRSAEKFVSRIDPEVKRKRILQDLGSYSPLLATN